MSHRRKRARTDTAVNPTTRDDAFLGIHAASLTELTAAAAASASAAAAPPASPPAPSWSAKFALDPYGTLREKHLQANARSMVEATELARSTLLPLVRALTSTPEIRGRCKVRAINPPLWTLGHVAFFYESLLLDVLEAPKENLRAADAEVGADGLFDGLPRKSLFDSIRVNRAERVASPLWADPETSHVFLYAKAVLADVAHYLTASSVALLHPVDSYIAMYAVIHEHWHIEDLLMTLQMMAVAIPEQSPQTLTFPMIVTESSVSATRVPLPSSSASASTSSSSSSSPSSARVVAVSPPPTPTPITTAVATARLPSWISVPASTYLLGASKTDPFVFGQEKWGHKCEVPAFQIARYPVTNEEFMQFIDDGGYENRSLWSIEGWRWKTENGVASPLYWEKRESSGQWRLRRFEQWIPVCPELATHPVAHVSYWEAEAYCVWCGGGTRLPTEAEWEVAATWPGGQRRYPWGSDFFMGGGAAEGGASSLVYRANLGHRVQSTHGTVPVAAFGQKGESALGLSQLVGNVWEWTRTTFYPFPGYQMDFPYRENAAPWFGFSKVTKGGAWSTSEYLAHSKHRNFYDAGGRREVAVGFRVVR